MTVSASQTSYYSFGYFLIITGNLSQQGTNIVICRLLPLSRKKSKSKQATAISSSPTSLQKVSSSELKSLLVGRDTVLCSFSLLPGLLPDECPADPGIVVAKYGSPLLSYLTIAAEPASILLGPQRPAANVFNRACLNTVMI